MKSARSFARFTLLAAGSALVLCTVAPAPALACGGEWYPVFQVDVRVPGVDLAEEELEQGRTLAAAGTIVRMIPHIRRLDPTKTKLIQRAHRVLAVATARFDGKLPLEREVPSHAQGKWRGLTEADREANREWAAKALRAIAKERHDDPAARTELAEALARVEATKSEARSILEELATKDLITSPNGYATLAALRKLADDEAGVRAALERCKSMTRATTTCDMPAVAT